MSESPRTTSPGEDSAGDAARRGATAALAGRHVLVCRAAEESAELLEAFTARGAETTTRPLIRTAPPADLGPLRDAAARWNRGEFDWLVVTSAKGAQAFADAGAVALPQTDAHRVAAVGPATAAALAALGFTVDLVPPRDFSGRGLADALCDALAASTSPARPVRAVLPLSERADTTVERALRDASHDAHRVTAYRTLPASSGLLLHAELASGAYDAVLLFSASGAEELARVAPAPHHPRTRFVAIGHPTAEAMRAAGIRVDAVAEPHTSAGLLDATVGILAETASGILAPAHVPLPTKPEGPRS